MAKHDHCMICDYTEGEGSFVSGALPRRNGKVRKYQGDYLCDTCIGSVADSYTEMVIADQVKEKENE